MKKLSKKAIRELWKEEYEELIEKSEIEKKQKVRENVRKYSEGVRETLKQIKFAAFKKIKSNIKQAIRRNIQRTEREEKQRLLTLKKKQEREIKNAKISQRLIVEFISRYGEETYYEFKRTGKLPEYVYPSDKKIFLKVFNGTKDRSTYRYSINRLSWKDWELEILSEIANYGTIIKEKNRNKPIYICNGVRFFLSNIRWIEDRKRYNSYIHKTNTTYESIWGIDTYNI